MRRSILLMSVLAAACAAQTQQQQPAVRPTATAPASLPPAATEKVTPAAALVDHAGDSLETAVPVPANAPNDGIDFENNWIYDRYGRFRRMSWGVGHAGTREIKTIKVELPDHSTRTVFFDVTEIWTSWKPPEPK